MFKTFKQAIGLKYESMTKSQLFKVGIEKYLLWMAYLESFPPGTNPVYKEWTEHDCQTCKIFIRKLGGLVNIVDNKLVSIWDIEAPEPYQDVANAMSKLVKEYPIDNVFVHTEPVIGVDRTFPEVLGQGSVFYWDHLFVRVPSSYIKKGVDIGEYLGEIRSTKDVFLRSLKELTLESVEVILDLIGQNSIYRGQEQKFVPEEFRKFKVEFDKLKTPAEQDLFAWNNYGKHPQSVSRIRNTSIGTLLS